MSIRRLELIADGRVLDVQEIEEQHASPAYLRQVADGMAARRGLIRGEGFVEIKTPSQLTASCWQVIDKLQLQP